MIIYHEVQWVILKKNFDYIKEENLYGNTEGFSVGTSDYGFLVSLYSTMIGFDDFSKVG